MTMDAAGCLGCLSMHKLSLWCTNTFLSMLMMTLIAAGCLGCLSMHKLCHDAPTHFYGCPRWPWMQLVAQDDPWCSWLSWMSIYAQVVPWCTKTFIGMIKITLIAPGCLGCWLWTSWVLKHHWDLYGCPWCSWMSWMSMDVQDDPQSSWMSWSSIDAYVLP